MHERSQIDQQQQQQKSPLYRNLYLCRLFGKVSFHLLSFHVSLGSHQDVHERIGVYTCFFRWLAHPVMKGAPFTVTYIPQKTYIPIWTETNSFPISYVHKSCQRQATAKHWNFISQMSASDFLFQLLFQLKIFSYF